MPHSNTPMPDALASGFPVLFVVFQQLQAGDAELLPLRKMAGRTVGVGVIPYPPGIPIVMPGENVGPEDGPWLGFLRTLQEWAEAFPGFEKEVEGSQMRDGEYHIWCLR
jgi:arginine decarboxylase